MPGLVEAQDALSSSDLLTPQRPSSALRSRSFLLAAAQIDALGLSPSPLYDHGALEHGETAAHLKHCRDR